jgi:hypothetical protein
MEQPQGSEVLQQKRLESVVNGTLRAVLDMCEIGKLKVPRGNKIFIEKEVLSERLHESSIKLWTPDTAARDTIISRLKGPFDT